MHELSIARSIVQEVERAAVASEIASVEQVNLRLGRICGIIGQALEFGFEFARMGTSLESAKLVIEYIEVEIYCPTCDRAVSPTHGEIFVCPNCGSLASQLLAGKELEIVSFVGAKPESRLELVENG